MNNNIIERLERIETKLDEVIAALHEYDDENNLHCEYSGLPSVMAYDETAANKRMDVIGQNGNTGEHYEYDDYGKRVENKDKSNNPAKHVGKNKKRNTGKKSAIVEHEKYRSPHKY